MIWIILSLIIPICSIPYLWPKLSKEERPVCFIPFGISLIAALILIFCGRSNATDTEIWGGWATRVEYYEDWNEYIRRKCTKEVGSGKNKRTKSYDCSYVRHHPERFVLINSNDEEISISRDEYERISRKFGNVKFEDLHRHYHTNDGDMYYATYNGSEKSYVKTFTKHRYTNKVQCNKGVFAYPEVDSTSLYEYAFGGWDNCPSVYGNPGNGYCEEKLSWYNSRYGAQKQIRIHLLIFGKVNKGEDQEAFWKGGNKNEFNACIGLVNGKIEWVHCFCWSPDGYAGNDEICISMRQYIGKTPQEFTDGLISKMDKWRRKSFAEFDYLEIEISDALIFTSYLISSLSTVFIIWSTNGKQVYQRSNWTNQYAYRNKRI